jgi:hypothetical protein
MAENEAHILDRLRGNQLIIGRDVFLQAGLDMVQALAIAELRESQGQ